LQKRTLWLPSILEATKALIAKTPTSQCQSMSDGLSVKYVRAGRPVSRFNTWPAAYLDTAMVTEDPS